MFTKLPHVVTSATLIQHLTRDVLFKSNPTSETNSTPFPLNINKILGAIEILRIPQMPLKQNGTKLTTLHDTGSPAPNLKRSGKVQYGKFCVRSDFTNPTATVRLQHVPHGSVPVSSLYQQAHLRYTTLNTLELLFVLNISDTPAKEREPKPLVLESRRRQLVDTMFSSFRLGLGQHHASL